MRITCKWFNGVKVSGTPSGRIYPFKVEQSREIGVGLEDVLEDDVPYLLSLYRPGGNCSGCSGNIPQDIYYFVKE